MKAIFNSIFKSIKKAAKWYFKAMAQSGYMMYTTGSRPVDYFYYERKKDNENKKSETK